MSNIWKTRDGSQLNLNYHRLANKSKHLYFSSPLCCHTPRKNAGSLVNEICILSFSAAETQKLRAEASAYLFCFIILINKIWLSGICHWITDTEAKKPSVFKKNVCAYIIRTKNGYFRQTELNLVNPHLIYICWYLTFVT